MKIKLLQLVFWVTLLFVLSGTVSAQSWQQLYNKADSLRKAENVSESSFLAQQSLKQAEVEFGKEHINYARTLELTAGLWLETGDYPRAESDFTASRKLFKTLSRTRDTTYADILYGLGILYRIQGKYDVAETTLLEAIQLAEQLSGKESERCINMLGSLGNVYVASQNYTKAEPLLLNILTIKEKRGGRQSSSYANTLNSLGLVYLNLEDYTRSESYMRETLRIWEKVLGPEHPNVGAIMGNLGFLYLNQGDYLSAIRLLEKAVTLQSKLNPGTLNHIVALINLGQGYTRMRQYEKAESVYLNLLPMIGQKLGLDHPEYATTMNNIGFVAEARKQYAVSLEYYQKALVLYAAKTGGETMGAAEMMSNIASVYNAMDKLIQSDSLYRKSLIIIESQVGTGSLRYGGTMDNYARVLNRMGQTDSAVNALSTAQIIFSRGLGKNFLYQTPRQKESILTRYSLFIRTAFDMAWEYPKRTDIARLAYSANLFVKNLLLSQQINFLSGNNQSADTNLQLLTDTLRLVNNKIATQYTLPITQRKNLDSLEARAETLEKDLARQSASFRQARQVLQTRWQDVRDALKPTEAAVEFVSFPYHNGREQTDSVRYMALVLRPSDAAPQVVPLLADEAPLRRLLAHKTNVVGGSALYATRGSELDTDQLTRGDSLYQLIWQPIDKLLGKTKTVFVSPSGLLHQVAFAALPYPVKNGTHYLADRYELRQVGSTRQIALPTRVDDTYKTIISATLYGGIRYDSATASTTAKRPGAWPFLPGTGREVAEISGLIGPKANQKTGLNATETAFKAQSGQSPSVLHVATHGFGFPDPTAAAPGDSGTTPGGAVFQKIGNPLFRTGLLMAGANRVWAGGRPALGEDDGILTAYEVANLNLSTTRLVVLSACETALGDIRGSEGVFGLQRAFKMAGAGYLLTSLWPVPDETTGDLMTLFYRNWKRHKTIRAAYQKTQQQMRQKYPPAVWAAFVLID